MKCVLFTVACQVCLTTLYEVTGCIMHIYSLCINSQLLEEMYAGSSFISSSCGDVAAVFRMQLRCADCAIILNIEVFLYAQLFSSTGIHSYVAILCELVKKHRRKCVIGCVERR